MRESVSIRRSTICMWCVCVCVCVYVYIYVHIYTCVYMYMCMSIYDVCIYTCTYTGEGGVSVTYPDSRQPENRGGSSGRVLWVVGGGVYVCT